MSDNSDALTVYFNVPDHFIRWSRTLPQIPDSNHTVYYNYQKYKITDICWVFYDSATEVEITLEPL